MSGYLKKNTVTRETLSRAIKRETGLHINKAAVIVDQLLEELSDAICTGKDVKIRLFGTFSSKQKNERVGRNPKTKVEAKIAARTVVKFKVAPTLKKRINSNISQIA